MRIRTLALALALSCGATTMVQAAGHKTTVQKPKKVKKVKMQKTKRYKQSKASKVKPHKAPKHK
jgi:hypothetical protein